jgi:hypothetical protein
MKHGTQGYEWEQSWRYQIKIQGLLDARWSDWFSGLTISIEEGDERGSITTLTGMLDQSALHAILTRIGNMNLKLISVYQIKPDDSEEKR